MHPDLNRLISDNEQDRAELDEPEPDEEIPDAYERYGFDHWWED